MPVSTPGPSAREAQRDRIVKWHARGQDALDAYGIPRFADGIEYTIAERVDLLAAMGQIDKAPRRGSGIERGDR